MVNINKTLTNMSLFSLRERAEYFLLQKIISRPTPPVGQTEDKTVTNNGTRKFQPYNKHMEPQEGARAPNQTQ